MKKREVICALIAGAAMLDVIGVVGSVDVGAMTMEECLPKAIVATIVAVIAVMVGDASEEKHGKERNHGDNPDNAESCERLR